MNAALAAFKYAKSVGALSHLIRNIAIGVGIVAGYKLFNTLNSDVSVDQYYMDGSGYQYTTDSTTIMIIIFSKIIEMLGILFSKFSVLRL